ncbi:hypothetical protein L0244_26395, partial [bacterium]|nr:hypothetical protein [bacterium]
LSTEGRRVVRFSKDVADPIDANQSNNSLAVNRNSAARRDSGLKLTAARSNSVQPEYTFPDFSRILLQLDIREPNLVREFPNSFTE